jgi:hypothetical protein
VPGAWRCFRPLDGAGRAAKGNLPEDHRLTTPPGYQNARTEMNRARNLVDVLTARASGRIALNPISSAAMMGNECYCANVNALPFHMAALRLPVLAMHCERWQPRSRTWPQRSRIQPWHAISQGRRRGCRFGRS